MNCLSLLIPSAEKWGFLDLLGLAAQWDPMEVCVAECHMAIAVNQL
jgi:hypothetical protein